MSQPLLKAGDRVVLSVFGTYGDIIPFTAIGLALKARGIEAVVATSEHYREYVESRGLEFAACAPSDVDVQRDLGLDAAGVISAASHPVTGVRFAVREIMMRYLRRSHADLLQASQGVRLVISHVYAFAAPLVVEQTGAEWRTICLQPVAAMSPWDAPVLTPWVPIHVLRTVLPASIYGRVVGALVRPTRAWFAEVDALRRDLGLSRARGHPLFDGGHAPGGTFGLFDPVLMPEQRGLPPNWTWAGFCRDDGSAPLDAALDAFVSAGDAPVVFTLGSSAVHFPGRFFDAAIESTHGLGRRAVLLAGERAPTNLPPHVLAVQWASHAALFPRAAVVVHHGGIGTTSQALRAGVPQLVVPHGNDQFDNARRVERLGAGRSIASRRVSAGVFESGLRALLDPTGFVRDQARAVAGRLQTRDGAEVVAHSLTNRTSTD